MSGTGDYSAIIAASQATSGAAGAYGQYSAGKFNAGIAKANARTAEAQAQDALRRGAVTIQKHRGDVKRLKSAQRASFAAQGVVVDQDVAQAVADDTDILAGEDEERLAMDATLEAWGYRVQATDFRAKAKMERYEGNNRAAGTLLSTAARYGDTMSRADRIKKGE